MVVVATASVVVVATTAVVVDVAGLIVEVVSDTVSSPHAAVARIKAARRMQNRVMSPSQTLRTPVI
jgi:hypothetical protein